MSTSENGAAIALKPSYLPVPEISIASCQRWPPKPGRILGYVRVSTTEQDLTLQHYALKQAIFIDTVSGVWAKRLGLEACLAALQEGDVLLV